MGRARTMVGVVVGLGGFSLLGFLRYRALTAPQPPMPDAELMRVLVAHEREKGNTVTEAEATVTKPTLVELPRGTFAVFAAIEGVPTNRIALDAGDRAGAVTLSRIAPRSLPESGLGAAWQGRLTVRLTGASAAHLAFFSDPTAVAPGR